MSRKVRIWVIVMANVQEQALFRLPLTINGALLGTIKDVA